MSGNFIHRSCSALLVAAMYVTSVSILVPVASAQTNKKAAPADNKTAKADAKPAAPEAAPSPEPASAKPLSVKEDPAQIGKRKINNGTDKLFGWLGGSQDKEIAIGRQLAAQVEQQAKMVDDPMVTEYINRIGQNVVLHSDAKVPFTIKVIDTDEVNAFALPGGFFFVNKGLILAADNEAELAGVMAHEIAHVAARHAMENQGKERLSITRRSPESSLAARSSARFCKMAAAFSRALRR